MCVGSCRLMPDARPHSSVDFLVLEQPLFCERNAYYNTYFMGSTITISTRAMMAVPSVLSSSLTERGPADRL